MGNQMSTLRCIGTAAVMLVTAGNQMVLVQSEVNHRTNQNREPSRLLSLDYSQIGSGSSKRRLSDYEDKEPDDLRADRSRFIAAHRWKDVLKSRHPDSYKELKGDWIKYSTAYFTEESIRRASYDEKEEPGRWSVEKLTRYWKSITEYVQQSSVGKKTGPDGSTPNPSPMPVTRVSLDQANQWNARRKTEDFPDDFPPKAYTVEYEDRYIEESSMQEWAGERLWEWVQMQREITREDTSKMFQEDFVIWYIKDKKWDEAYPQLSLVT